MGQVEGRNQRAADTLMSGVERRNTAAERKALRDAQKKIEDQKLSSLADQIDFVLKHQNVPGAMDRFASLAADMTAVSQRGFERSQQLKEQLWRANLTQAGAKIGGADMRPIVSAIQKMNPDDPESIRAALATIRQPSLMGPITSCSSSICSLIPEHISEISRVT
jgi:phytoene dehydrogenase-like protein